jgi:hypothetical protein
MLTFHALVAHAAALLFPTAEIRTSDELSNQSRDLVHMNVQTASLFGNSSDMQYFYLPVYMG